MKQILTELTDICKTALPKGRNEYLLFFILVILYGAYAISLQLNSSVIDWPYPYRPDMYLYLDTNAYYHSGLYMVGAHPLLIFITKPALFLGELFINLFGYKSKGVFFVLMCIVAVSLTIVYVYRYLTTIIKLKNNISLLLVLFFALFSTNLILAFSPESFTMTLFFLSLMLIYFSKSLQTTNKISITSSAFFAFLAGGITLTNFPKGILPMFLSKGMTFRKKIQISTILSFAFLFMLVLFELRWSILSQTIRHIQYNIKIGTSLWMDIRQIFENFFGSAIFFPKHKFNAVHPNNIELQMFHAWWQYFALALILIPTAIGAYRQRKNKVVQLIGCMFVVDVFVHFICLFGLREAFIYGGHWIFFVPILFGWLYKSLSSKKAKYGLTTLIAGLSIFLIINNIPWMINLYQHLVTSFPSALP